MTAVRREVEEEDLEGTKQGWERQRRPRGRKSRLPVQEAPGPPAASKSRPRREAAGDMGPRRTPPDPGGRCGGGARSPGSSTSAAPGPRGGRRPRPRPGSLHCHPRRPPREPRGSPGPGRAADEAPCNRCGPANPLEALRVAGLRPGPSDGGAGEGPLSPGSGPRRRLQGEGHGARGETEQKAAASALADVDGNLLKSSRTVAFVAGRRRNVSRWMRLCYSFWLHSLFTQQVPGEHPKSVTEVCR